MIITEDLYEDYFGVDTAPTSFDRLYFVSLQMIKTVITKEVPTESEDAYEDFQKALMEQVKFLYENEDLMSVSGNEYSLGRYSEKSSKEVENNQTMKRLSPISYAILLNAGLLYVGL